MARQQLDAILEWSIFAVLLGIVCFAPLATGAVRAVDFLVIQFATVVLVGLWAARCWVSRDCRLLWPPICWAVAAFASYTVIRYLTADIEYVARQEMIRVLVYACIFFVAVNNVMRREQIQWLSLVLVVLAAGVAAYGVYQWGAKSDRVWTFVRPAAYAGRGSGTFICPNHLAGFLELILPLGLAYALAGRGPMLARMLVGYLSLVIAAGIAVTISRAGWVAAAAGLLLFFILKIQRRQYRWPALGLLVLLVAAGAFAIKQTDITSRRRMDSIIFTHEYGSGNVRSQIWSAAAGMWRDHFWTGVGPAHFDHRFPQYRMATPSVQARPDRVHNDYLNTLADWGVVGFVIVLAAWVLLLGSVMRVWKYVQRSVSDLAKSDGKRTSSGQSNRTAFVVGAVCGLTALLLHSLFDFNLHIPATAILVVTLMALLTMHWRFASERWWCSARVARGFATVLAVAAAAYLGSQGVRRAVETRWLRQADRVPVESRERLEALKQAYAAEPMNADTAHRVGEFLRLDSWEGADDYREKAEAAIGWFERAALLNPYDSHPPMRQGMCLVWLGKPKDAGPHFERAERLDPNSYYTLAHLGWYRFHLGDTAGAKQYFERSLELTAYGTPNPIARSYLELIERRAKEPPSLLDRRP